MDAAERKARILYGQHLTAPAEQSVVCRDLNGVQAQFSTAALHALSIRTAGTAEPEKLVKSWTLRGTVHLFDPADLPLYLHEGRTHYLRPVDQMVADEYISLERKRYFADLILERLTDGPALREELKTACFGAGMTEWESESVFNSWGGTLRYLAETGQITHTVGMDKAFQLCPPFTPMEEGPARLEMARRYFATGPATVKDAAYFFGKSQREVKGWMNRLPLSHAEVDGQDCFWLENGQTNWPDIPDCLFLAGFDQLMLSCEKKENPFLPAQHLRGIFNLSGIVMAPILLHGSVTGRWKRSGKKLLLTPFGHWSKEQLRLVCETAEGQFPCCSPVVTL